MNFNLPSKLLKDGSEINNSKDIANAFNDFFIHVDHNLATSVPSTNGLAMSHEKQTIKLYLFKPY